MRILITTTSFFPAVGGARLHWHKIGSLLVLGGHRVQVVTQWTKIRADWLLGTTVFAPRKAEQFQSEGMEIYRLAPTLTDRLTMFPLLPTYHALPELTSAALARPFRKVLVPRAKRVDLVHNIRIGRDYFSRASYEAACRRVEEFFSWDEKGNRLANVYQLVTSS